MLFRKDKLVRAMDDIKNILYKSLERERRINEELSLKIKPILEEKEKVEEKISHYEKLIILEGGDIATKSCVNEIISGDRVGLTDAIRAHVSSEDGDYDVNTVGNIFSEKNGDLIFSKNIFNNIMKQRMTNGLSERLSKGKGRSPSVYKNVK